MSGRQGRAPFQGFCVDRVSEGKQRVRPWQRPLDLNRIGRRIAIGKPPHR